jgi:transcriptional regulator with XRE-family HTH domain
MVLKMSAHHFADALASAISELQLSQKDFAEKACVSPAMVAKLLARKPGRLETYRKIFAVFHDALAEDGDRRRRAIGIRLAQAFLRDTLESAGLSDQTLGTRLDVRVERGHGQAVNHMFAGLPRPILLALYAVGSEARKDDDTRNQLLTLAEAVSGKSPGGFPKDFFASSLSKPPAPRRLVGGSLGDLLLKLGDSEE